MNEPLHRSHGPAARAAVVLGCTEGRVYTLAIGLVLAVVLAVFGWPAARIELLSAGLPPGASAQGPPASAAPGSPDLGAPNPSSPSPGISPQTSAPVAPDTTTTLLPSSPSSSVPEPPRREPGYLLPPELQPVEAAVANLVRDGCSRLSLVNVVVGLLPPEVREPLSLGPVLSLLTQVYIACDKVAFPPTRVVCALDMEVNAVILRSPLGLFLQSLPPVIGHAVALLTAPTDSVFGALGVEDPLVAPLLMEQLGCVEIDQ